MTTVPKRASTRERDGGRGESDGEEDGNERAVEPVHATKSFRAPRGGEKRSLDVYVSTWNVEIKRRRPRRRAVG